MAFRRICLQKMTATIVMEEYRYFQQMGMGHLQVDLMMEEEARLHTVEFIGQLPVKPYLMERCNILVELLE